MTSIYGKYEKYLPLIMDGVRTELEMFAVREEKRTGSGPYEHIAARIKAEDSMREKCRRQNIPETAYSALYTIRDAIGLRIVTRFVDDIYKTVEFLRGIDGYEIVQEKDYVKNAKPNGYRSYHVILRVRTPYEDIEGNTPGYYFVEVQIRTIAMDTWAALEHEIKYKKEIPNEALITKELKRCADELAACDSSMQTLRDMIRGSGNGDTEEE